MDQPTREECSFIHTAIIFERLSNPALSSMLYTVFSRYFNGRFASNHSQTEALSTGLVEVSGPTYYEMNL